MKKIYLLFILFPFLFSPMLSANQLPHELRIQAVSERLNYSSDFDYQKIGRFSQIPIFTRDFHAPKHLVDKVVVNKSHHQMLLLKNNKVVKRYWIALSDRPQGHKVYEGDKRTPEGTYTLDYIKRHSVYYKAFHISYPNAEDVAMAKRLGKRAGGMIMVHGQPNNRGSYHDSVQKSNWTNGCIALLNHEIDEFISMVDPGTPITINP